jgi:hypothetical protein
MVENMEMKKGQPITNAKPHVGLLHVINDKKNK